ncbi:MAG: valine--tRNA ligase [Candidatus Dormibacteraeota bacterium]|uniref:Valine--tRNA ligase n=1 Tax=Candidatus Amunia macphersoniae TaxID=3127014 RepID=A0A934KNY4_9BACT|nr:valine--tRNA ligase [Candidatus Dormibacteraeota bacterium]
MDKAFDPRALEPVWRARWDQLRIGIADPQSDRPKYSIGLPPPNITGVLHLGHAMGFSIQDALARNRRMCGYEVEWCPGTDHAAIATQNVIERQLAAEGTTKEQLGRPMFKARVDAWYEEYGGRIFEQMRRLGFTCDWSRARFTLDEAYVRAIRTAFKCLFDDGLIYRGPRIVNWCPRCLSAISDEEIDWQEHSDSLVYLRYPVDGGGEIVVATVRPETMLGDAAVAVAPGDPRYRDLVGRTVRLPLTGRTVPIVEDQAVQPEFGTGALKVTPAHDPTDYEIGERHRLPMITVIAPDGTMDVPDLPQFDGIPAAQARLVITEALRQAGVLVKEEEYTHEVGHCDRSGDVLEPLISAQWWVRMGELSQPAIAAISDGHTRFHPSRYTDVYLAWMSGIRDWCISRQIWLGHAIPVSTCANGHTFAWIDQPAECPACGDAHLEHDTDVLDTWFSSGLWPFAIFGWPEDTADLARFYPTDVCVTARDIIFLWVARMIVLGLRFTGRSPFAHVVITSTVQAADGTRMNKSKGNAVDPLVMIEEHGADAVRAWAASVGTGGQDVRFHRQRIESYQRFANKIWNATRFLVARLDNGEGVMSAPDDSVGIDELEPEDRWMLSQVAETVEAVDASLAGYRFHEAMDRLYEVTWHSFCDWYVEMIKPRLRDDAPATSRAAAAQTAITTLDVLLRLLHPFMPFITEECAQRLPGAAPSLQLRDWPQVAPGWREGLAAPHRAAVDELLQLVQRIRILRNDSGVAPGERHRLQLSGGDPVMTGAERRRLVTALVLVEVEDDAVLDGGVTVVAGGLEARYHLMIGDRERERAQRRLTELEQVIATIQARLANPGFTGKAKPEVVAETRRRLDEALREQRALRAQIREDEKDARR